MNDLSRRLSKLTERFGPDDLDKPEVMEKVWERIVTLSNGEPPEDCEPPLPGETLRQWYTRRGQPCA